LWVNWAIGPAEHVMARRVSAMLRWINCILTVLNYGKLKDR
jgi:hypothetical protein